MGTVVDIDSLTPEQESQISRLLVYYKKIRRVLEPQSVNKQLAEALLECKQNRRSMKMGQIFDSVLARYPDGVIIKDIDVMFNPEYQIDVLKILVDARKRKDYRVIWPGRYEDGKLTYGEEGYLDYKVFDVENYDITCVIGGYDK